MHSSDTDPPVAIRNSSNTPLLHHSILSELHGLPAVAKDISPLSELNRAGWSCLKYWRCSWCWPFWAAAFYLQRAALSRRAAQRISWNISCSHPSQSPPYLPCLDALPLLLLPQLPYHALPLSVTKIWISGGRLQVWLWGGSWMSTFLLKCLCWLANLAWAFYVCLLSRLRNCDAELALLSTMISWFSDAVTLHVVVVQIWTQQLLGDLREIFLSGSRFHSAIQQLKNNIFSLHAPYFSSHSFLTLQGAILRAVR